MFCLYWTGEDNIKVVGLLLPFEVFLCLLPLGKPVNLWQHYIPGKFHQVFTKGRFPFPPDSLSTSALIQLTNQTTTLRVRHTQRAHDASAMDKSGARPQVDLRRLALSMDLDAIRFVFVQAKPQLSGLIWIIHSCAHCNSIWPETSTVG